MPQKGEEQRSRDPHRDSTPVFRQAALLFRKVQVVPEPLPPEHLIDREAGVAVRQRQEEVPAGKGEKEDDGAGDPRSHHALARESLAR